MSNYEILSWDTQFFGFRVARVVGFDGPQDLHAIIGSLRSQGVRVAYLTANPDDTARNSAMQDIGAVLVDEKVTYTISTQGRLVIPSPQVSQFVGSGEEDELISIACQAGEYSRFRVDANFGPQACDRLYTQWIRNDTSRGSSTTVYVYRVGPTIAGLITLRGSEPKGSIGLIGVSTHHRGHSIGTALMGTAFWHYKQQGIDGIEVVTQRANIPACRFYQKHGFEVKSVINYYHLWL